MNSKFKLPKIDILFQLITFIRHMVLPLVLIFINTIKVMPWWGTLSILVGVLLLLLLFAYLGWRSFYYVFMEDRIIIYSGVFVKKEKTIYYQRIHSVNISQNIVHRLLKLANLSIETPGVGMGKSDGEIRCLSIDKAKYLQTLLQRMGEASRSDSTENKEQLLHSIVSNMDNSTSREVVEHEHLELDATNTTHSTEEMNSTRSLENGPRLETKPEVNVKLDSALMFKSAVSSLNLNIVFVWFAGLFAFADDILNVLFPNSTFIDDFFEQLEFNETLIVVIVITLLCAMVLTWLLSLVLYIINFYDYKLERKGKQIHVSYGLFNRQSIVFNETKVQSIVFEENPIRQFIGYGELKVKIVKAVEEDSSTFSSYIVIHPYIHKDEVASYIAHLMPKRQINAHEHTEKLPKASLRTYLFVPLIAVIVPSAVSAIWLKWYALMFIIVIAIVAGWRLFQFKTGAFSIDQAEIKLVSRTISRQTVYVRRQNLIVLSEKATPYQRKRGLRTMSFNTLGGLISTQYALKGISAEQMERAKAWLSQYLKR